MFPALQDCVFLQEQQPSSGKCTFLSLFGLMGAPSTHKLSLSHSWVRCGALALCMWLMRAGVTPNLGQANQGPSNGSDDRG